MDEDLDEAAQRVLNELTGVKSVNLIQFKTFGSKTARATQRCSLAWKSHQNESWAYCYRGLHGYGENRPNAESVSGRLPNLLGSIEWSQNIGFWP